MEPRDFSDRVRTALERARMSQMQFSELSGVSQPTISEIVRSGHCRLETYSKVLRAIEQLEREYGVSPAP